MDFLTMMDSKEVPALGKEPSSAHEKEFFKQHTGNLDHRGSDQNKEEDDDQEGRPSSFEMLPSLDKCMS